MANKPSVYIETTIASFLTARPSGDLIVAARQLLTRQWWEQCRSRYDLFVSQIVVNEAGGGDPSAAQMRLAALQGLPLLKVDDVVLALTTALVEADVIPDKAAADAGHVAVAARHGMSFLLTWNCTHIANAFIWKHMGEVVAKAGFRLPVICTPDELLGEIENE